MITLQLVYQAMTEQNLDRQFKCYIIDSCGTLIISSQKINIYLRKGLFSGEVFVTHRSGFMCKGSTENLFYLLVVVVVRISLKKFAFLRFELVSTYT